MPKNNDVHLLHYSWLDIRSNEPHYPTLLSLMEERIKQLRAKGVQLGGCAIVVRCPGHLADGRVRYTVSIRLDIYDTSDSMTGKGFICANRIQPYHRRLCCTLQAAKLSNSIIWTVG